MDTSRDKVYKVGRWMMIAVSVMVAVLVIVTAFYKP